MNDLVGKQDEEREREGHNKEQEHGRKPQECLEDVCEHHHVDPKPEQQTYTPFKSTRQNVLKLSSKFNVCTLLRFYYTKTPVYS